MELINGDEGYIIPEDFWTSYNVCQILMDQLREILVDDVYAELGKTTFEVADKSVPFTEMDTENIFDWLVNNDQHDTVTTTLTKHITRSILSDFHQFMSESINATRNGKHSVAYALCRKPFLDELLILEQILVDKEDFIQRYYIQGSTDLYDPSNRKLEKAKQNIIKGSIEKLPLKALFDAQLIYDIRYEKSVKYGINWISNQALHIVTTDPNYKTSNKELNFVFSVKEDFMKYWRHYYDIMPMLLFYATSVLDEIVFQFLPDGLERKKAKAAKRLLLFIIHLSKGKDIDRTVNLFSNFLKHKCKMCSNEIKFELADFTLYFSQDVLLCGNCGTDQFADREFTDKFGMLDKAITPD